MIRSFVAAALAVAACMTAAQPAAAQTTPPVGTVRGWLGLDDALGNLYRKDYTLRGVGDKVEVWVANDAAFPAGDCRAQIAASTVVTDAQVAALVAEFENNVFPKETSTFSTPPDRDGSNAQIAGDFTGDGDKTVVLVDNIRDANFYDFPANPEYFDAFFSPQFVDLLDRNVITLDVFDWAHRTGATPPDEPTADPCTSRPALPRFYESGLARAWQSLALFYADPFEVPWVGEGLSGFAQSLTGYVDATAPVLDPRANRDLLCFQGFGGSCGGPEGSLTLWNEGERADRGHAYSFMLFLADRYGTDVIRDLHRDGGAQGLASLRAALQTAGVSNVYGVIHDFQSMVLLDEIIGDPRRATVQYRRRVAPGAPRVRGALKRRVTTPSLRSTVDLTNPNAYDDPGAAPNGADYVPLQDAGGVRLTGAAVQSVSFAGAPTLPTFPLIWSIVSNDPDRAGNPVLFSGNANNLNAAAVTAVTVPTGDPTLRFLAKYGAEFGFDYAYVQVSTDGGATYTSIAGDRTISGPLGQGLNGTTNGFEPHAFDLSAYAGQNVLLAFRYVADGGVNEGGILIDDVTLGATSVSDGSSLAPFDSPTEVRPVAIANWNLRIVGFNTGSRPRVIQLEYDGLDDVTLSASDVRRLRRYQNVVAIVAYDEPTETVSQYAPYTLTVNGVVQPGGN